MAMGRDDPLVPISDDEDEEDDPPTSGSTIASSSAGGGGSAVTAGQPGVQQPGTAGNSQSTGSSSFRKLLNLLFVLSLFHLYLS